MDPMDFTMDDGHQLQHPNPPRCPYQQPQQTSSSNNFPQSHNAHHYDPVHNTESWYSQHRPHFTPPQNISGWGPGSHIPISSWNGFSETNSGMLGADVSGFRPQPGFAGMPNSNPWAEIRGYDPLPFGYTQYMHPPSNNVPPIESGITRNPISPTSSAATSQMPPAVSPGNQYDTVRRNRNSINIPALNPLAAQIAESTRAQRASREDMRTAQQSQVSRSYDYALPHTAQDPSHSRRRMAHTWDSDDDEDSAPEAESEGLRREQLYADFDDERTLASMRGAIAAGKKVPSKDAIASIEKLAIKDLGEADKSCIICYNDFGVQNPEGLIEHPIRLPKCKHIFGDKCIKKWFEDSDTCPYCRDKLPSERVAPKSYTYEAMHARHRERAAQLSAAHASIQSQRARHAISTRYPSSDEFVQESLSRSYTRQTQEEYHYLMRSHQSQDSWSFSPLSNRASQRDSSFSQRDSPERRRQQARGRAALGRPTSVGSARYYASPTSYQTQRANIQGLNTNVNAHGIGSIPHRPSTPPMPNSNTQSNCTTTPTHNPSSGSNPSSEEASPAVVVGSGVASGDRSSSSSQPRLGTFSDHSWLDHPFGEPLNQTDGVFFPVSIGRPNDFPRAVSFESRASVSSPNSQHTAGLQY